MDPATLATSCIAILAPYVAKAGKELVETVGQVAYDHAKTLFNNLKARWSSDPAASTALTDFEKNPKENAEALRTVVQQRLESDKQLQDQVAQTVKDMGPRLDVFMKITEGEDVVGAKIKNFTRGTATVNIEAGKLVKGVGADVENLG
jgi:hypothetical protein